MATSPIITNTSYKRNKATSSRMFFVLLMTTLLIRPGQCYPHKRDLNQFPQVINILEDGNLEQLRQTRLLQNISTALLEEASSFILQEQTSSMVEMMSALTSHSSLLESISDHLGALENQSKVLERISHSLGALESISTSVERLTRSSPITARDCSDIASQGPYASGIYTISPWDTQSAIEVYCDITTGDGWTVLQRRFDGSEDFNRGWEDYKNGFGNLDGEFWLGLSKIFRLVRSGGSWQLRVELQDFEGNTRYAEYDNFTIGDESTNFQLISVGQYEGTAGDGLTSMHLGQQFSTKERDHDSHSSKHCAADNGAWWHKNCYSSNLNGAYHASAVSTWNGVVWNVWKSKTSLKAAEMKIKLSR